MEYFDPSKETENHGGKGKRIDEMRLEIGLSLREEPTKF